MIFAKINGKKIAIKNTIIKGLKLKEKTKPVFKNSPNSRVNSWSNMVSSIPLKRNATRPWTRPWYTNVELISFWWIPI